MRRHDDSRKPLWITEIGWSSAGPVGHPYVMDPATQAALTRRTLALLQRESDRYGLTTVIWYRLRDARQPCRPDREACWEDNTGLFTADDEPKPAWSELSRAAGGDAGAGPLARDALDALWSTLLGLFARR
jgi:hypothetical protein